METFIAILFHAATIAGPVMGGVNSANEPHFSLRDGCKTQEVLAPGGGYKTNSVEHCRTLPRMYGGKPWAPSGKASA